MGKNVSVKGILITLFNLRWIIQKHFLQYMKEFIGYKVSTQKGSHFAVFHCGILSVFEFSPSYSPELNSIKGYCIQVLLVDFASVPYS